MRSSFKLKPLNKRIFNRIADRQLVFMDGWVPLIYILPIPIEKKYPSSISLHNGRKIVPLRKLERHSELLFDNFFFSKQLKLGNFLFRKKHCVFRHRKKK